MTPFRQQTAYVAKGRIVFTFTERVLKHVYTYIYTYIYIYICPIITFGEGFCCLSLFLYLTVYFHSFLSLMLDFLSFFLSFSCKIYLSFLWALGLSKDSSLVFTVRLGHKINFRTCLWVLIKRRHLVLRWLSIPKVGSDPTNW